MSERMEERGEGTVRVARSYDASPERVYRAWTDAEEVARWWAPPGFTEPRAEMDVREGGGFRIAMKNPEGTPIVAVGTFREVRAPERLVYTWKWEGQELETVVTVEISAAGDGSELVLVHEGFPDAETAAMHRDGWNGCVDRLEEVVGG